MSNTHSNAGGEDGNQERFWLLLAVLLTGGANRPASDGAFVPMSPARETGETAVNCGECWDAALSFCYAYNLGDYCHQWIYEDEGGNPEQERGTDWHYYWSYGVEVGSSPCGSQHPACGSHGRMKHLIAESLASQDYIGLAEALETNGDGFALSTNGRLQVLGTCSGGGTATANYVLPREAVAVTQLYSRD